MTYLKNNKLDKHKQAIKNLKAKNYSLTEIQVLLKDCYNLEVTTRDISYYCKFHEFNRELR